MWRWHVRDGRNSIGTLQFVVIQPMFVEALEVIATNPGNENPARKNRERLTRWRNPGAVDCADGTYPRSAARSRIVAARFRPRARVVRKLLRRCEAAQARVG